MPAYESLAPIDADINVSSGHVEVVASDRADTTVEVTPTSPGRSGDVSLARQATVAFENNRLRVRASTTRGMLGRRPSTAPSFDSVTTRTAPSFHAPRSMPSACAARLAPRRPPQADSSVNLQPRTSGQQVAKMGGVLCFADPLDRSSGQGAHLRFRVA